jgi:hypothetical protein
MNLNLCYLLSGVVCVCVRMYVCIYVCVCTYVRMYVYVCVCMYVYLNEKKSESKVPYFTATK